jgi:hypothetical protein
MDFDRVSRKQIARLKKAKQQRLLTRQDILNTYGLRSRERISKSRLVFNPCLAIDEEITSMMKNFEADQKRLRAIMLNFEEKKPDMVEQEKKERQELILMIKDSFNLFKLAFNEQTLKAERGAGVYINETDVSADVSDRSKAAILNKSSARELPYKENETQQAMLEDSVAV